MTYYYIKGAIPEEYVSEGSAFILEEVQYPRGWDLSSIPGAVRCEVEARPDDRIYKVGRLRGVVEDGVHIMRYEVQSRSAADIARIDIDRLERSITDRMWREDAVGSTSVMQFGTDDPRTGKTATQYIGYVNSAIANIRAGL